MHGSGCGGCSTWTRRQHSSTPGSSNILTSAIGSAVFAESEFRGSGSPFEGAVRAILGQQVSVARATVLAANLCERFGGGLFPSAEVLARAEVAAIGMPGTRGRAVSKVAERVADEGDAWLTKPDTLRSGFADIPGVGPWTTEYTAMRVARDPDAFPDTDWGVFKALGCKGRAAREWAEPCRPWRAYATMVLWATGRDE